MYFENTYGQDIIYKKEPRLPQNRSIFWKVGPLQYRLTPLGECSKNASISVYQQMLLWDAAFGFNDFFFFGDSFNSFAHFIMGDLPAHLPTPHWVCSSFWPKTEWPLYSTLPIHLSDFFFVSLDEKIPQREMLCQCGRGEKNGKSTKRYQNQWVQKLCWALENCLHGCIAANGEYFEGVWSLNMQE